MKLLLVLCFTGFVLAQDQPKDFTGYKIIDMIVANADQALFLETIQLQDYELDFWSEPRRSVGRNGSVMVPPHKLDAFTQKLQEKGIHHEARLTDVQQNINAEREHMEKRRQKRGAEQFAWDYNSYNTYADFLTEINRLASSCSGGLSCGTSTIATSHEGRQVRKITLSTGSGRRVWWVDSLIHSREWLAGATLMKIIQHMITNYGSDSTVTSLLNAYDFHFVPLVNPDGYAYTFSNDRYWRKNRVPNADCVGTDMNRNFNYRWGTEGVSHNGCQDTYCGPSAASEREVQGIQNQVLGLNMAGLVTIHSYYYCWLFPYSNTVNGRCDFAPDHADLMAAANAAADATQQTHGQDYWQRGNGCEILGPVTGATDEWAKGAGGVKYAYTIELRGVDFVISPSHIQPSFEEIWNGLVALINQAATRP